MDFLSTPELLDIDRQHVWHPYAAMPNPLPMFPVKSAQGVYLELEDGRRLVDGMSSWWTCIHGYGHPRLNQAAKDQIDRMAHVMFGGLTHQPAVQLAQQLIRLTPEPLQHVFFCDSGSVAVEVAMKMAIQYWFNLGQPQKNQFLTIRNGYHGDIFAAMSVCDPVNGMHHLFHDVLRQQFFADAPQIGFEQPWDKADIDSLAQLLEQHHHEIGAVIFEPVVQGAGGMRFYNPEYVRCARELCDQYDVLLILDEIATGFGRSGRMFACEYADISPDILCLGKALTGGFMSLAATLTTKRVSDAFAQGEAGVLMHGPTFMGNPLACAVALESIAVLEASDWPGQVSAIADQLKADLAPCRALPAVRDVRVLGAIGVVELHEPVDMATVQPQVVKAGAWLRPFGRLLYTMPPYIISTNDLRVITRAIHGVCVSLSGG